MSLPRSPHSIVGSTHRETEAWRGAVLPQFHSKGTPEAGGRSRLQAPNLMLSLHPWGESDAHFPVQSLSC